jgi:glycosyltransferase involved in cell wall biosynthesis
MKILIGTVPKKIKGGVYATEAPFERVLNTQEGFDINIFHFGSRKETETIIRKICDRFIDLIKYIYYLIKFKPDIVHLNSAFTKKALIRDMFYVLISNVFNKTLFIKYHGSDAELLAKKSPFWKTASRICVDYSSGIGLLSSEEKANFVRAGFGEKNFFVVKNSIDCQRFSTAAAKKNTGIPQIFFISRFIPSKGLTDVIKAVGYVLDSGRNVELVCVGDGPEMPKAHRLVQDLGIQNSVKLEGFVPEEKTTPYYLNSSMLVFPTKHDEGFSMVIFQSVAAGLPIITTKIRGAADYLKEPDNCLWTEPDNPGELAEKIVYLLDHPEDVLKMTINNKKLAWQFAPEKVAEEYLDIYSQLLYQKN